MSKDESEGKEIDSFVISKDVTAEIWATEEDVVKLLFGGESTANIILLYPNEAERIAQAMLKAVKLIKSTQA